MWEPGFWKLTDRRPVVRAYLEKAGSRSSKIRGPSQWANFEAQMQRVLPGHQFFNWTIRTDLRFVFRDPRHRLDRASDVPHPAHYYGVFEDNDPSRGLMVVANFDNDVPEYWEWSGEGLFPFSTSNEAYKLGVNDTIYGITH